MAMGIVFARGGVMPILLTASRAHARAAPCFVVSPHLDDAVFSCGGLLARRSGSIVCTVFCGTPEPPLHTPWDSSAGHRDSSEAMRARIAEDEHALSIVGARGIRLPFLDSQYGATPTIGEVARALAQAWRESGAATLVAPLGLYHSDHILVSDACLRFARELALTQAIVYEDALYRTRRDDVRLRYEALAARSWTREPLDPFANEGLTGREGPAANAKWRAVHAYRSQLRAFADPHPYDLSEPERYTRLVAAAAPIAARRPPHPSSN
jgi:LmbE family N-acetylglucosaminyl deacetylase